MHTITFAARQTGLSQHTIRSWERRYAALSPDRTATNRRLYSASDILKLSLLHRAIQAGHSIGQIASLSIPELQRLLTGEEAPSETPRETTGGASQQTDPYLDQCNRAMESLDAEGLEDALTRAAGLLGVVNLIDRVLLPFLYRIGERWHRGELQPASEHLATAVVRTFLGRLLDSFQPVAEAPILIVTTPAGQLHELGALIAAVTAASTGWRALYLGPNLPAEEIARAALQAGARAVALSIVYPSDDPRMDVELSGLRTRIGWEMPILAGGRAGGAYLDALASIRAIHIPDLQRLRTELEALRMR